MRARHERRQTRPLAVGCTECLPLRLSVLACAAVVLLLVAPVQGDFVSGHVFWGAGSGSSPFELIDITGGGNFTGATPFAIVGRTPGQMTWRSSDLTRAYLSEFANNRVVSVSSTGVVTPYATGITGPTGLLWTSAGRLLVVAYSTQRVYDITGGGDFSGAVPFATGFSGPRNLIETQAGRILLADQTADRVYDITAGGSFTGNLGFARSVPGAAGDLVQDGLGRLYVSTQNAIYDITSGGDFTGATAFATGQSFHGLAIDGSGRLLASCLSQNTVFDVTAGGDFAAATPFATNLPGAGDTMLDTVPFPVPEPHLAAWLLGTGVCAGGRRRRATGSS